MKSVKNWMWVTCLYMCKYARVCTIKMCVFSMYITYTLHICVWYMCIGIHNVGKGCKSPNHSEVNCFKWDFHTWSVCDFYLRSIFQEQNPGIKWNLPLMVIVWEKCTDVAEDCTFLFLQNLLPDYAVSHPRICVHFELVTYKFCVGCQGLLILQIMNRNFLSNNSRH